MAATDIAGLIEAVSEAIVFLEPDDLNGLADIHSQLEDVDNWANDCGFERTSMAAVALREILEKIILQEYEAPEKGIAILTKTLGNFQNLVRQGIRDDEIDFPVELGIPAVRNGKPSAPAPAAESLESQPIYSFAVQLPAYVDESIFSEFLSRQVSVLEEVESALLDIEQGNCTTSMGELTRHLHTLKGETALLGLDDIEHLCHLAEDLLDRESPPEVADRLLALKDWLKQAFDTYAGNGTPPVPPKEMERILIEGLNDAAPIQVETEAPVAPASPPAAEVPTAEDEEQPQSKAPPETESLTSTADKTLVGEGDVEEGHNWNFSAGPLTGDRELIADFVVEATEHLDTSDVQLLTLEMEPRDLDAINAIFRAFHTIKGVCGFIALEEMQALAHEAENLLDMARKDVLILEGPYLDVVFDAIDMLKAQIANVRRALEENVDLEPELGLPVLLTRMVRLARGEVPPAEKIDSSAYSPTGAPQNLGEILVEQGTITHEDLDEALELQENTQPSPKKLGQVLQDSALVNKSQVNEALHLQQDSCPDEKLGEILINRGAVDSADVAQSLRKQTSAPAKPKLGEVVVASGKASARDVAQALRIQKEQKEIDVATSREERPANANGDSGAVMIRETVKVDAYRLDQLVDMIGELVIAESMVCQSKELRTILSTDLTRQVSQLDKITRELQEMAMGLRMVPVRPTFQKMARLVRDVARKTGKEVNFNMQGEDTELDKTVVDRISDPLVHMIRNSVDHGLEANGSIRKAAGKSVSGTVTLRAYHSGGSIHIEISDDGRGLDREAILSKARERNLISDNGESMPDKEIWQLIFEPGFSTAKQLTEVSGRGVGMDVVRRNIEALRGEIDIHSEAGVGSRFTIKLPLTLAIIDGMVVRVGAERYIIPTLSIVVSVRPKSSELYTIVGAAETMKLQGEIIPLFRLHELFDVSGAVQSPTEGTVVVLENTGKRVGLLIDEILGQQQIVIKALGDSLKGVKGIAGGAIMPDGKVGLILDIADLVRLATEGTPV